MRRNAPLFVLILALAACSRQHQPPTGRWIGNYESSSVMVDCRLEITPDGLVRVSAPDDLDVGTPTDAERATLHARLAADVAQEWSEVASRRLDFDGHIFRKPGGIAPQMEWDPKSQQMKVVFYFGMQRAIRIDMHPVPDFEQDPWADEANQPS